MTPVTNGIEISRWNGCSCNYSGIVNVFALAREIRAFRLRDKHWRKLEADQSCSQRVTLIELWTRCSRCEEKSVPANYVNDLSEKEVGVRVCHLFYDLTIAIAVAVAVPVPSCSQLIESSLI